jgi:hypothetical protein
LAEGSGSFGRVRTMRYRTALGSARETLACLEVGEAFGYVETVPDVVRGTMKRVLGTLVRVAAQKSLAPAPALRKRHGSAGAGYRP